jgi:hypothetical protein
MACFAAYAVFMNFHGSNENASVKMVILLVIQHYLALTVCGKHSCKIGNGRRLGNILQKVPK